MPELTRRDFLKSGLVTVSAGIGVPSLFARAVWAREMERVHGAPLAATPNNYPKCVVIVQLAGGHDLLDTIVPYENANYPNYHPTGAAPNSLNRTDAINAQQAAFFPIENSAVANVYNQYTNYNTRLLNLSGHALHPALQRLAAWYRAGKLAIVNNVGYRTGASNPYSLSHFRAMDIYQSGRPDTFEYTGWMGRFFNSYVDPDHSMYALNNGSTTPMALRGNVYVVPSITSISSYNILADNAAGSPQSEDDLRKNAMLGAYSAYGALSAPYAALLSSTASQTNTNVLAVQNTTTPYTSGTGASGPPVVYPNHSFGNGLKILAQIITQSSLNGLGARVLHISMGGFDTHSGQSIALYNTGQTGSAIETNPGLWKRLDDGLDAFFRDLARWPSPAGGGRTWADEVVIMTWSEFGRRLRANNSNGTDHGKGICMFLLGNRVAGGQVFGGGINLNPYNPATNPTGVDTNGDLRESIDFRQVYQTILNRWFQFSGTAALLGNQSFGELDLFAENGGTPAPTPGPYQMRVPQMMRSTSGGW